MERAATPFRTSPRVSLSSLSLVSLHQCCSETLGFSFIFLSVWPMKNKHGIQSPKVLVDALRAISWLHGRLGPSTWLALVPRNTSPALAQCGDGTARPASRPPRPAHMAVPLRTATPRHRLTGTSRFRLSAPRRTEPQEKHTGTAARPRRPWPGDGDGRRDLRFSGAGTGTFSFQDRVLPFLTGSVSHCCALYSL
jgi:hypothetical protein